MAVRTLKLTIAIALGAVLIAGALQAASYTYTEQSKRIKAGVLLTPGVSSDPAQRPDPYVFYVMDQRQDLKPSGWEFYNPFAPSHATQDICDRWNVGVPLAQYRYQVGQTLDKKHGAYWEVTIADIAPDDLAQYDVLYLSSYSTIQFNQREREKLRKFVDNGGVLWVDFQRMDGNPSVHTVINPSQFFIPVLAFNTGGNPLPIAIPPVYRSHSVLNRPFTLSQSDVNQLGGVGEPNLFGRVYNEFTAASEAAKVFVPLVLRGGNPVVSAAQYGSGYVIMTSDGVGQAITDPVSSSRQVTGECGRMFVAAHPEDLRLAFNIVNWGSEHSTYQKSARRTGHSFAEIGSSLVSLWDFTMTPGTSRATSPAILDDMIFYVDSNNVLHAFDLSPIRDRDGDGNPDDGIADYSTGAMYDELWNYPLGGPSSPPTAAYAPITGGAALPAVFVVTKTGSVWAFNALGFLPGCTPLVTSPIELFPSSVPSQRMNAFTTTDDIPAPTYADGSLYVGDGLGFLHVHNFYKSAPSNEWTHPLNTSGSRLGIACSPTVGYFHDPTSGATEQIVYIANRGSTTMPVEGSIRSYPIRTFNERLTLLSGSKFRTRSLNTPIDTVQVPSLGWANNINDLPIPILATGFGVDNPGKFDITDANAINCVNNGGVIVADYFMQYINDTVAYTDPNAFVTPAFRTINISHPTAPLTTDYAGISGPVAAGRDDVLYFGTENGSIYAVRENGRAAPGLPPLKVKWRWWLGDPKISAVLGATFSTANAIKGSPVVVGDMVYVMANSDGGAGYLLAFRSDPVFSIKLKNDILRDSPVSIQQYNNMSDPGHAGAPNSFVAVSFTDLDKADPDTTCVVDYDEAKVTILSFRSRNGGPELTASEDIVVNYTPDIPLTAGAQNPAAIQELHAAFSSGTQDKINNLVWFMKLSNPVSGDYTITSPPTMMGDVLYVACTNAATGNSLVSIDVTKAGQASGSSASGVSPKLWLPDSPFVSSVKMPTTAPITAPVAGSHGMLAVSTANGLSIMYNPTSLVADGNRLLEVDSQGHMLWACDSTNGFSGTLAKSTGSGVNNHNVFGAVNVPFNRPSVARRASIGGMLVADTGNNRIVHIDKGGSAIWQIRDFVEFDPTNPVLPPGSPMELNKPTDVSSWQTMEYPNPLSPSGQTLPAYHYLIADSGNNRVIEIVARYDPSTGSYRNVVKQVSRNLEQGEPRRFTSVRVSAYGVLPTSNVWLATAMTTGPVEVVCSSSNETTTSADTDGRGGSLIRVNWLTGQVIGKVTVLPVPNPALAITNTPQMRLMNPSFFNRQWVSNTEYMDVVIDSVGVHTCHVSLTGTPAPSIRSYLITDHVDIDEGIPISVAPAAPFAPTELRVTINNGMAGAVGRHARPFAPSYAQYLPNGNLLVTNKATGTAWYGKMGKSAPQSGAFYGEVFELTPAPGMPKYWRIPGTSTWQLPPLAELHQPMSAERLLN